MSKLVKIYHCGDVYEIPLLDALEYVRAHLNNTYYSENWGKPIMSGVLNMDAPRMSHADFFIMNRRLEAMKND